MKPYGPVTCEFCSEEYDSIESLDTGADGWFCDCCDAFNYYFAKRHEKDQFLVILENKAHIEGTKTPKYTQLKRNLSPLRYPGGKSKMIDYLYQHLYQNKTQTLYSPFTGGASFELAMLEAGVIKNLVLNDLDYGIYSFWFSVLHMPEELIYRIRNTQLTHADYFKAQQHMKNNFIGLDMLDAGFYTLLVNRLAYSGIPKANPLGGKNGSREQLLARWNPNKLIQCITKISKMHPFIQIHCEDAYEFTMEAYWDADGTIFLDPPYVIKGADLYNVSMSLEEHRKLCVHLDYLYRCHTGANVVVTYDFNNMTDNVFDHYSNKIVVGRKYSI